VLDDDIICTIGLWISEDLQPNDIWQVLHLAGDNVTWAMVYQIMAMWQEHWNSDSHRKAA